MTILRLSESHHHTGRNSSSEHKEKKIVHGNGTKVKSLIYQKRVAFEIKKENYLLNRQTHRRSNALLLGNVTVAARDPFSSTDAKQRHMCPLDSLPPDNILSQLISEAITAGDTSDLLLHSSSSIPSQITPSSSMISSAQSSGDLFDEFGDESTCNNSCIGNSITDFEYIGPSSTLSQSSPDQNYFHSSQTSGMILDEGETGRLIFPSDSSSSVCFIDETEKYEPISSPSLRTSSYFSNQSTQTSSEYCAGLPSFEQLNDSLLVSMSVSQISNFGPSLKANPVNYISRDSFQKDVLIQQFDNLNATSLIKPSNKLSSCIAGTDTFANNQNEVDQLASTTQNSTIVMMMHHVHLHESTNNHHATHVIMTPTASVSCGFD